MIENLGPKIEILWEAYQPLIPHFTLALIIALILTPLMGRLAARIGAMDLPAYLRKRSEAGLERNINEQVHPRLGGLAMAIAILLAISLLGSADLSIWGIIVGVLIIIVYGLLDDVKDLPYKYQLLGQVLAAGAVVVSGITITGISLAGMQLDFVSSSSAIEIGGFVYNFLFPADLITIFWIVAMINFVNWMSGMDGLNHAVSAIASFMILLIAVDSGNLLVAALVSAHLGANLGSAVFNYPPSYIFPGAIGEHLNGFLLAVFAVMSGGKLPLAIIALAIPIVDALWVIFTRIRLSAKQSKNPIKMLLSATKADTNHLHHRLMSLGFSWKAILGIEVGVTIALSAIGFYLSGFRDEFVALVASLSAMIIIVAGTFAYSHYAERKKQFAKMIQQAEEPKATIQVVYRQDDSSQEEKFVY